jgi:hypothetical protein
MYFSLPKTKFFKEESFGCDKIYLSTAMLSEDVDNELSTHNLDYAIIKLDHLSVPGRKLELSLEGFNDGFEPSAISVNVQDDFDKNGQIIASQSIQKCTIIFNSVLMASFNNKYSPVGLLLNCRIIPGNSGSPLVDDKGKVFALIQASDFRLSTVASNIACAGSLLGPHRTECEIKWTSEKESRARYDQIMSLIPKIELEVQSRIGSYILNLNRNFKWAPNLIPDKNHSCNTNGVFIGLALSLPQCEEISIREFSFEIDFVGNGTQNLYFEQYPVWPIHLVTDKMYQLSYEIGHSSVTMEIVKRPILIGGGSSVKLTIYNVVGEKIVLLEKDIPACDQTENLVTDDSN